MKISLNKNTLLSLLLTLVTLVIIIRIIPVSVDPVLKLVISKNSVSINNINQVRSIEMTKEVMVDRLNLAEQNRFKHPKLGELGYSTDFFVDLDASFTVKQAGNYQFIVASDDGFKLSVDGRQICHYPGSRPISTQTCDIHLSEGVHQLQLNHFQGFGNAGIQVQYKKIGSGGIYWVGENSSVLRFD